MTESEDEVASPHRAVSRRRNVSATRQRSSSSAMTRPAARAAGAASCRSCLPAEPVRLPRRPSRCRGLPRPAAQDLHPGVEAKLVLRMRGRPHRVERARTWRRSSAGDFRGDRPPYSARSVGARLHVGKAGARSVPIRYFARAITPPGRTAVSNSFLRGGRTHIANLDRPFHHGTDELLTPHWFTFDEAHELDLPGITRDVLKRLKPSANQGSDIAPDHQSFSNTRSPAWREETALTSTRRRPRCRPRPVVKIDHLLIEHADAARRHSKTDAPGL